MQVGAARQAGSELHAWRQFLGRSTLWLGVWLLGSAVICWVAANWQDMSKIQRFAGAQALLAVCVLAAAWAGWRLRAAGGPRRHAPGALLALAGLLLGALLALLGQTYQTGADTWELFAWWAVLLLPWAVVAASQAVWLLWMAVVNLAALLYFGESGVLLWWTLGSSLPGLLLAALNLLLLAAWECAAWRWRAGTRIAPRALAALAIGVLVLNLMFGESVLRGLGSVTGAAWAAATLGLGYYYQRARRDLLILAMLAAGVICVSMRLAGEWLLSLEPGVWAILPLAGLLMAEAVWAARWLRRLAAEPSPGRSLADAEPAGASAGNAVAPPVAGSPVAGLADADVEPQLGPAWYVQGLLGLSAWLTTLLLLLFLGVSGLVQTQQGAMVVGLVLCAVAVAVLRTDAGPFWRQCATAMGFAGQILVVFGLSDSASLSSACAFVLLLGVAVYALAPDPLLRFLSAWMIALALAGLIWLGLVPGLMRNDLLDEWLNFDTLRATFVWLPVAVAGAWTAAAAFCVGHRLARTRPNVLLPLAWAFVLAVQGMVWMAGGTSLTQLPAIWNLNPVTAILTVAGVLLPVACALAVLWPRRRMLTAGVLWGVPLGLLALALFWLPSPGIAFALAWMLLGFGLNRSRLTLFGGLSLLLYLLVYYYQLQVPLLDKALWLAGAALLMFFLRGLVWLVPRLMRTAEAPAPAVADPPSAALRWRTAVVLGGLVLALVVVNGAIWQRETLLAHGRVAILELAPVDPRSLMQGDYMALRFAAGNEVMQRFAAASGDEPLLDGYVVLVPDGEGVAQVARIQAEAQPRASQEIALRYRLRAGQVRIVTNAYFFPEGQAERYASARYGEVRVGDDGTGLLVRMLGADRRPL
ncbi:DUF4401 domain-containing protein [Bordetella petrii]|nr:DUF4401 domain-containing protein [Bordetella petrii]